MRKFYFIIMNVCAGLLFVFNFPLLAQDLQIKRTSTAGSYYKLPDGSVIGSRIGNGVTHSTSNHKTPKIQSLTCPVPIWDASPSDTLNCNSACATLMVRDSASIGG